MMPCTSSLFPWYIKHIQQPFERILAVPAGICQPALLIPPLRQTTVIKVLLAVFDDKRNNIMTQTLFQSDQSSYSPIPVLEGMDMLELRVKRDDIINRNRRL